MNIETATKLLSYLSEYATGLREYENYGDSYRQWLISEKDKNNSMYEEIKEAKTINQNLTGYIGFVTKKVHDSFFKNLLMIIFGVFGREFPITNIKVNNLDVNLTFSNNNDLNACVDFFKGISPYIKVNKEYTKLFGNMIILELGKSGEGTHA